MLWLNFFRDLKSTLSRMVSVTIITMLAVMVYVGLAGVNYNVDLFCEEYFQEANTADYWITGVGLSEDDCGALGRMDGVTAVQPRLVLETRSQEDNSVIVQFYASPMPLTINMPTLTEGSLPANDQEMVLSDEFAAANGLAVGDWYELTVPGTPLTLNLRISGLGKSAELMRHISVTTPSSDLGKYGFAYLDSGALEALTGGFYNQICLTVAEGTDGDALLRLIDEEMGERVASVMAREDNTAAYSFKSVTNNLQPVLDLFPILFFLCSILLMVSNMSRLIEGARMNIGTFKALGYRDGTILRYYLLHAVLVVLVGFPLGALPSKILTRIIVATTATGCDLPDMPILFNYAAWVQAFVLTAVCCIGSAFWVARATLQESPAQSMRPKPPKSTKPVLLERIPTVWRRLTFNQKYITRNTLRNKPRMLTCIVGITFCMSLVLAAFGLRDSVTHYVDALTTNQNRYDIIVTLDSAVTEEEYEQLAQLDGAEKAEYEMTTACWLYSDDQLTTVTLHVAEDRPALRLYDPYAESCALPTDGLVLEKDIADTLGVAVGDTLSLRFLGDSDLYQLRVAEVNRGVSGVYIGRSCWQSLDQVFTPTTAYLTASDQDALTAELDDCNFVDGWQTHAVVVDAAAERLDSASMVAYVMILFGGGLACVVIYNLGIMSFFEQVRGLATLMVLGFFDREIRRLQLSENTIFAAVGVALGLPFGVLLTHAFINALDALPLEVATRLSSFFLSIGLTMLFALLVNAFIGRKMKDIDMLGALKSVE